MIKSASQYLVHTLFSHEGNVLYRIPPYQREYSWYKAHWEDLFEDLIEAEGAHFLGTIITLDQTTDTLEGNILHVVDGQQRLTTLTLLLAAIYSVLREHVDNLDDATRTDVTNLSRQLVRKADQQPRVTPQRQGQNPFDYLKVLEDAGLPVEGEKKPYYPSRRIAKCYRYFRSPSSNSPRDSPSREGSKTGFRNREQQDDTSQEFLGALSSAAATASNSTSAQSGPRRSRGR